MKNFFFKYLSLANQKYYGWKKLKMLFFSFIILFIISIAIYYYIWEEKLIIIFTTSSQELINAFSIISWFLLTSISIILATTDLDLKEENMVKLKTNLWTNKKWVQKILNDLRKILLYEVWIQFILIILITILIALVKIYSLFVLIVLFLSIISFTLIIKLLSNFLQYKNITSFDLEDK
jgi:hypothetical protein